MKKDLCVEHTIDTLRFGVYLMDMCQGLYFGSSVLGNGALSKIPHIPPLLYSKDFSCTCAWSVSYPGMSPLEFVGITEFCAADDVQDCCLH